MINVIAIAAILLTLILIGVLIRALFHDPGERARPFRDRAERNQATDPRQAVMADHRYPRYGDHGPAPFERDLPEVHHDEYALPQRWHPRPAAVTRVSLPPLAGPALLALAAIAAHLAAIEQARAQTWQAEVLKPFGPWEPWPGDDTLTGMRAITDGGA